MAERNEVLERSYSFAVRVVRLARAVADDRVGRVLFNELLRAGTSIGANVEESQGAESRKDFLHKLSIARKEARETLYWLRLLADTETLPRGRLSEITDECEQLIRMLTSIIMSTKEKP